MVQYYENEGVLLRDDGHKEWSIYNGHTEEWERTTKAFHLYQTAGSDPFHKRTPEWVAKFIEQEREWYRNYWKEHPDEWAEYKKRYPERNQ